MFSPQHALPLAGAFLLLLATGLYAQSPAPADDRAAIAAASAAERAREMGLLGIAELQPPATAYDIGKPGNANYDEAKANPYPKLPPLLVLKDATPVRNAAQWQKRRAEIKALFDENVYGKYPAHIPAVTWKVTGTDQLTVQPWTHFSMQLIGLYEDTKFGGPNSRVTRSASSRNWTTGALIEWRAPPRCGASSIPCPAGRTVPESASNNSSHLK